MLRGLTRVAQQGILLLALFNPSTALEVEIVETVPIALAYATGEFTQTDEIPDPDPIDGDCLYGKCVGLMTRTSSCPAIARIQDGSLDYASRYACTEPEHDEEDEDDDEQPLDRCGIMYRIADTSGVGAVIASVKIALAEDSISTLRVYNGSDLLVDEWEATPGSGLEDIPGVQGATGNVMTIQGVTATGEYLSILEVEIYVTVDSVEPLGVSAATRMTISATPDEATVTVDGDASDTSSWTCSSADGCEITYDLGSVQSLEQLRIAFANDTDGTGTFDILAAVEESSFSEIRTGIAAGGRPADSDDLQTFGAVRTLAQYIKLLFTPPSDGEIGVNEVEFRVDAIEPARPVDTSTELVATGMLPMGGSSSRGVNFDARSAAEGGCDAAPHFEGCHVFYVKDGDMDTRWSCGYMASGAYYDDSEDCDIEFSLNYYRYVRQIQVAFGDDEPREFSIEAYAEFNGQQTVVPSAISSVDDTGYQTFNVSVYAKSITLSPIFQRLDDFINIKEIIILEEVEDDSASVLPIFDTITSYSVDSAENSTEALTTLSFDCIEPGTRFWVRTVKEALGTGLRMKFPEGLSFTFDFQTYGSDSEREYYNQTFTSAGGPSEWEYFMFDETVEVLDDSDKWGVVSVSGPSVDGSPNYPTLRVLDLQILGELAIDANYKKMVTTTSIEWDLLPDIIGDGIAEQEEIMTAICEHKGSTYDGIDCAGDLDDTPLYIKMVSGYYYLDGPVYVKSNMTLFGASYEGEQASSTYWVFYDGDNNDKTDEDAVLVVDGVVGATIGLIYFDSKSTATGEVVDGTLGNLCMEVRDSEQLSIGGIDFAAARAGAARWTDVRNISARYWWGGEYETGNFMEFTRVDDLYVTAFPNMTGLYMEDCNRITFEGFSDVVEVPDAGFSPPTGGDQTANVVITGNSSDIVFIDPPVYDGDPRILMESTEPLTLNGASYLYAESGDCIIEVPTATGDDLIIQLSGEANLTKSGTCWVLE